MPTHFSPEALKFFRGLKRNNDREWFNARKATYEQEIKAPMLALIAEINEAMLKFAPDNVRLPQKALFRIYRDTRFSPDKRPYKSHQGAWWARTGLEKTSGAGFYFHIAPDEVMVAADCYMPEREQLLAIRRYLAEHYAEYRRIASGKKLRSVLNEFDGMPLTRPPKGFPADHPAIDLLRCRQWGVSAKLPASVAISPALFKEIVKRFEAAAPMVELLNTPLVPKPRKPLF
jgi:uncharacterized protein (TIGR02453 family)